MEDWLPLEDIDELNSIRASSSILASQAAPSQVVLEFDDTARDTAVGATDFLEQPSEMTLGRLLFSFKGGIGVGKFWLGVVSIYILVFASIVLPTWIPDFLPKIPDFLPNKVSDALSSILDKVPLWVILVIYTGLAVSVKRCHDLNASPWILLFHFIPIANLILLIYLGFNTGQEARVQLALDIAKARAKAEGPEGVRDYAKGIMEIMKFQSENNPGFVKLSALEQAAQSADIYEQVRAQAAGRSAAPATPPITRLSQNAPICSDSFRTRP